MRGALPCAKWILVAAMGLAQVARAQIADPGIPETLPAAPPEQPRNEIDKSDPWRALQGQMVEIVLNDKLRIRGRLVDVAAETLVRARTSEVVSLRRNAIGSLFAAGLLRGFEIPPGRDLAAIRDDLADRAGRKVVAGTTLMVLGGIGYTFMVTGLIALASRDNFAQLYSIFGSSIGGTIGTVEMLLGIPLYSAGRSEEEIVARLRSPLLSVAPIAPLGPTAARIPSGTALALTIRF
jgi:hypothetical protein